MTPRFKCAPRSSTSTCLPTASRCGPPCRAMRRGCWWCGPVPRRTRGPHGARSAELAARRRRAGGQRHQGDPGAAQGPPHRPRRPSPRSRRRCTRRLDGSRWHAFVQAGEAAQPGRHRPLRRRGQGLLPRPARRHGRSKGRRRRGDAGVRLPRPGARSGDRGTRRHAAAALHRARKRAPDERDRADYQTMFARDGRLGRGADRGAAFHRRSAGRARRRGHRAAQGDAACRRRHVPAGQGRRHRRSHDACRNGADDAPRPPQRSTPRARAGGRIVAVGSTALRLLESAAARTARSGHSPARPRSSSRRATASARST